MGAIDRLQRAVAGFASGIVCGIAGALAVCVFGGMVLPKLLPELRALASVELFVRISIGAGATGAMAGLLGRRPFQAICCLILAGPLSLLLAIGGLFAGAFGGLLVRLALLGLGYHVGGGGNVIEHDILTGCAIGIAVAPLIALRLYVWPPSWMWWRHP